MPTADNSQTAKIRHLANKNIAAYKLLNPVSQFPDQSTFIQNVEGRLLYMEQTGSSRIVDDSINILNNEILGIGTVTSTPAPAPAPAEWVSYAGTEFNSYSYIHCVEFGSGTWLTIVQDTTGDHYILTSKNPTVSWTPQTPDFNTPGGIFTCRVAAYGNGLWCIPGVNQVEDVGVFISDETWNWNYYSVTDSGFALSKIYYADSKWVILRQSGNMMYVTTDPSGEWSIVIPDEDVDTTYLDIYYGDGLWCLVGANNLRGTLYTASDPSGPWGLSTTEFNVIGEGFTSNTPQTIAYGDYVWVHTVGNTLFTTTNPLGEWIQNETDFHTSALSYGNGLWVASGEDNAIHKTTDTSGNWVNDTSPALLREEYSSLFCNDYGNGLFIAAGLYANPLTEESIIQLYTLNT